MTSKSYKPKFTVSTKNIDNDKVKLWVKMPDREIQNIWTIHKDSFKDEDVKKAIIHAFYIGYRASLKQIREHSEILGEFSNEFK